MKGFRGGATIALVFLVLGAPVQGQVATGNIRGTVLDTTDAVMPNVKITITNTGTGVQRVVSTNDSGDFNAPFMPLGDYQIAAEITGFQKKVISGINLQVDQTTTIRIVLEPGAVTQFPA